MKKVLMTLAAFGLSAAFANSASAQNLVTNGDFEQGLAGWATIPGQDINALKGSVYVLNAGGTGSAAAQANTMASFGAGNVANISTLVSGAFATTAGTRYKLSFDFAQFGGSTGEQLLTYMVYSLAGIDLRGTEQQAGGTNLDTIFTQHGLYFTGSGNPTNVAFSISGSPTVNVDALLDNVVITAVPEASTWAMMLLGFGVAGGAMRRRRRLAAGLAHA